MLSHLYFCILFSIASSYFIKHISISFCRARSSNYLSSPKIFRSCQNDARLLLPFPDVHLSILLLRLERKKKELSKASLCQDFHVGTQAKKCIDYLLHIFQLTASRKHLSPNFGASYINLFLPLSSTMVHPQFMLLTTIISFLFPQVVFMQGKLKS